MSLLNKLLAAFTVVLLPVLGLLLFSAHEGTLRQQTEVLRGQIVAAEAAAAQVDEMFDAAIGIAWAVAASPVARTMDAAILDEHLRQIIATQPHYDAINIYDAQGINRGWGHRTEPAEPRLDISDRDFFQVALAENRAVISSVLELARPAEPGIIIAVPIRGDDRRPIGVVTVVAHSDPLARRYREAQLRPHQEIVLLDRAGQLAFHTQHPDLPWVRRSAFRELTVVRRALERDEPQTSQYVSPIDGETKLAALVRTPRHGWVVLVGLPLKDALAPIERQTQQQVAIFGGILLLCLGLSFLLARLLSEPVRRLRHHARALGAGELGRRVRLVTGDELEQLGNAFDEMAAQLEARQLEIQRLQAEAENRARRNAAIINSINDAVFVATTEGRIIEVNPVAQRLLGVEAAQLVGAEETALLPRFRLRRADGGPLEMRELPLHRAAAGDTFSNLDLWLVTADGQDRLLRFGGAPVRDESGREILAVVVAHDITEEWRREHEKEALARISRALVSEPDLAGVAEVVMSQSLQVLQADAVALWLADSDRRRLILLSSRNLSPATVELLQIIDLDASLLVARAARSGTIQAIEDVSATEEDLPMMRKTAQVERAQALLAVPLHSRNRLVGAITYVNRRSRRFRDEDIAFNATVSDLFAVAIERAHLYDDLRGALRVREEFMAAAAHELKTPITAMKGWAQLLLKSKNLDPRTTRALETIITQSDRVTGLVDDLLILFRLQPGPPLLQRDRFDLIELARCVAERTARRTDHPQITVADGGPIYWIGDQHLIERVLSRLIENAVRYSPAGQPVEIGASVTNNEVVVCVRDRGYGIAEDRQRYVFEPFFQPVPPGVPGYVGLVSLGPYLSKQIVEAHGGRIWFDSREGEGSTFCFSLPRPTTED